MTSPESRKSIRAKGAVRRSSVFAAAFALILAACGSEPASDNASADDAGTAAIVVAASEASDEVTLDPPEELLLADGSETEGATSPALPEPDTDEPATDMADPAPDAEAGTAESNADAPVESPPLDAPADAPDAVMPEPTPPPAEEVTGSTGHATLDDALGAMGVVDLDATGRCIEHRAEDEGVSVAALIDSPALVVVLLRCDPEPIRQSSERAFLAIDVDDRDISPQALECAHLHLIDFMSEMPFWYADEVLRDPNPPEELIERLTSCDLSPTDAAFVLDAA